MKAFEITWQGARAITVRKLKSDPFCKDSFFLFWEKRINEFLLMPEGSKVLRDYHGNYRVSGYSPNGEDVASFIKYAK